SCHQSGGDGFEKSGLDLSSYEGVMKGTKHGPMVVPKDPDSSNLMWLLDWRASPALRMPHGRKKLSTCDRNDIRAWVREGALNNGSGPEGGGERGRGGGGGRGGPLWGVWRHAAHPPKNPRRTPRPFDPDQGRRPQIGR